MGALQTITDDAQGTATSTVTIDLTGVNDPPEAIDDTIASLEDVVVVIDPASLLANDLDDDGDTLSFVNAFGAVNGTVQIVEGEIIFTPDTNFFGDASFEYEVTDGTDGSDIGLVTIEVAENNIRPTAVVDNYAGVEDTSVIVWPADLLGNDFDINTEDTITFVRIFNASDNLGNAFERPDGSWLLTPNADVNGVVVFNYQINDGRLNGTGQIEVDFTPVNDAPTARDDAGFVMDEDSTLSISLADLVANDADIEDDAFSVTSAFDGDNGTVVLLGDTVEFTPRVDHFGNAGFTYTVTDVHGASANAYVSISVLPANDLPVAVNDTFLTVEEDSSLTIDPADLLANDSDPDGDTLIFAGFDANPRITDNGDGTFAFTPLPDEMGTVRLAYTLSDGQGGSARAFVDIDVTNTPDAPVGVNDTLIFDEDQVFQINAATLTGNDVDVDGDFLSITNIISTNGVSVSIDPFVGLTITPDQDLTGDASFTYRVEDSTGLASTATVNITLRPVNDAPVIAELADIVSDEDTLLQASLPDGAFTDVDFDSLLITPSMADGSPLPAWLSYDSTERQFSGTPPLNFNGTLELIMTADDGTTSTTAPLNIVINPVNDAPVIAELADIVSDEDTLLQARIPEGAITDVDLDSLLITPTMADGSPLPSWLSYDSSALEFTGTPPQDFNGTLELLITADDGTTTTTAPLNIVINPVNDAPVAGDDIWDADQDIVITIPLATLLTNDNDVDGDALTITGAIGGDGFTAVLDDAGNLVVERDRALEGTISVGYTLSDGHLTDEGAVEISLIAANQAPVLVSPGIVQTAEDEAFDITLPEGTVTDPDGDAMTLTLTRAGGTALPAWLSFDASAQRLTGTPPSNFNGVIALALTADDGFLSTSTEFTLEITAVNDIPILLGPLSDRTANEDTPFNVALQRGLFEDVDGDVLSFEMTSADGSALPDWVNFDPTLFAITGQAPQDFEGDIALRVTASDGQASISDDFNLTIIGLNDAPIVIDPLPDYVTDNDGNALATGSAFVIDVPTGSFIDPDGDPLAFAAQQSDGTALPSWLAFDGVTFSGTAPRSASGVLELELRASDGQEEVSDIFTMTFEERNAPPVVTDISISATVPNGVSFNISDLINAATDSDGDTLTITAISDGEFGIVDVENDVAIYLADYDYEGTDSFTYDITDGIDTTTGTVTVTIDNPYIGDDAGRNQDVLIGGDGTDVFFGGSGADLLSGGGGTDFLFGGRGDDVVFGGDGSDFVSGGNGDDTIDGGSGNDLIFGGNGLDNITGGTGNDLIFGGRGADTFNFATGDGSDSIYGFGSSRERRNGFIPGDELRLSVEGINNVDDLLAVATQTGGGVLFDFGNGDEIFLAGTRLASLDSDQFTFY